MAKLPTSLRELCMPAAVYFVISTIALLILFVHNMGNVHSYRVGTFSCRVPHTMLVLAFKFVGVLFWTYVLNLICHDGHKGLSWLLVLLPWISIAVIIGLLMINM